MKERGAGRWEKASAIWLGVTLSVAALIQWVPGRWLNPSLFQTSLLALGAAWAAAVAYRPERMRWSFPLLPLAAAAGWGVFQLLTGHTVNRWNTWMAVLNWTVNLAVFFAASQACGFPGVRKRMLQALLYFGFVLSVVSVLQYFSGGGKIFWAYQAYEGDMLGPFVSRDRYAAFIELLLPIAVTGALRGGVLLRYAVMGAAMYASVIAGASRMGALLTTAEIAVVLAIAWIAGSSSKSNLRSAAATLWLAAIVFSAVVGWVVLWNRLQDPDPLKGRREMVTSAIAMVRDRPVFGFGLGSFQPVYPRYAIVDFGAVVNHAHNDWVEWAADGGIPFSLLLLSVAVWSISKALKNPWGIGIVAVFTHSVVDFPLQDPLIAIWLFGLLGAMAARPSTDR
jgi:O-antigen ligase